MVGAADGPQTVFEDFDGFVAFWATTYRTGRYERTVVLREGGTGKVLLSARQPTLRRNSRWDVRAGNGEPVVTVAVTPRAKYQAAQFKLTVYPAWHSRPAIKVKPDPADPCRVTVWAVPGGKRKTEEGAVMGAAVYSSYQVDGAGSEPAGGSASASSDTHGGGRGVPNVWVSPRKAALALARQQALAERSVAASAGSGSSSGRGSSAGGGDSVPAVSPPPSPPRPLSSLAGEELETVVEQAEEEEEAGSASGAAVVSASAAVAEAQQAGGAPGSKLGGFPADAAIAAEEGPGVCSIALHPRAEAPLVCCLLAIHRAMLAPPSLEVSFDY